MTNSIKKDLGKNTFQFDVNVTWSQVQDKYDAAFDQIAAETQIEGFRRGKAPKNILSKHIKKDLVYKKLVELLIPELYSDLIKQENLQPLVPPQVSLLKAKENEDWSLRIIVAQKPIINLNNYQDEIKKAKAELKQDDIWVPGKDKQKETEDQIKQKQSKTLNKILEVLLKKTIIEISDIIIEQELNKKLSQLVDDVSKIGLKMEAYLQSKNETMESIKNKYKTEIEETYKLEFALEAIAEEAKIVVEKADLESLFSQIKEPEKRKEAEKNSYFYASLVRRQKTLDYLLGL
ncbi:hypothetical protein A3C23_03610 [Candidatus Roizmanbacteria bacterium RIFCSPHIGHO2_02_FULL_37_13b]|uniref:Trigger factor n=1 Tax=Candidatus Roizmanbacteria bacterium RIFCSPLOWO2_02_FULL_36_11 TaxID=1802071 RepID=A0A1F7JBW2_9BACT|nr:MAG: hypothetical protein A3C23_03610 [Candidatus Roizmanbacteria bacterium RIFCSPHIGHO2_02_FULL_37_13b]OGK53127.1 MAG: hypothetical protein A3H78_01965 [Candidatus Roizmanbacteria bacterium RIFCSPLOWO2_02_FULL_36_11]